MKNLYELKFKDVVVNESAAAYRLPRAKMRALALSKPTTTKYDTILGLALQPYYQGKQKSCIVKGKKGQITKTNRIP